MAALSSLGLEASDFVSFAASVDVSNRPEAVRLLWQVSGRRLIGSLRSMLDDSSGSVRIADRPE